MYNVSTLNAPKQSIFLSICFVICLLFVSAATTNAATFTVTNTNDSGAGSLAEAIGLSNANGEDDAINFDASVFAAHQTIHLDAGFAIAPDGKLTIIGPAAGVTLSMNSTQFPIRAFSLFEPSANLEISNMTLTGGNTFQGGAIYSIGTVAVNNSNITGNSAIETGGGITNRGGSLTVVNSTVTNNLSGLGGGIFNGPFGTTQLTDSIVSDNSSTSSAGGIYNDFGTVVTLANSTVSRNSAAITGGGIENFRGTMKLTKTNVKGNSATSGGGISNNEGMLTLNNSAVSNNSATTSGGGGISNIFGGRLTIADSSIKNNSAVSGGGGIANLLGARLTVTGSTVSGNTSGGGGGIFNRTIAPTTVENSTISGNSASMGGGLLNLDAGSTTLINTTVSENTATEGGGIHTRGSTTNLKSSIVANSVGGDCFLGIGSPVTNAEFSLIEDGLGCVNGTNANNVTGDPMLGSLSDNGGPTWTHALIAGSPAIDAGNSILVIDQRGFARPVDFPLPNAPGSNASDIGAFEADKDQCKNGGWIILGNGMFGNQGNCVSFINAGN